MEKTTRKEKVILHIDGDAFFASVMQSVNPSLKGKPIATGKERGIATAFSYEAKNRGVRRGMTLSQINNVRLLIHQIPKIALPILLIPHWQKQKFWRINYFNHHQKRKWTRFYQSVLIIIMTCTLLFYPYKKQKIATSITTVNWQECSSSN